MADCCPCDFIQVGDFMSRVPMPENVDSAEVMLYAREVQIAMIKPLFCKELYDEICQQVSEDNLSDANEALMCYVRDIHVRYAFADFLFHHPYRVTASGVVRKVSDESEFMGFSDIEKLVKDWRGKAQNYIDPMYDWMKDNTDLNPLFDKSSCGTCEPEPAGNDFGIL